MKQTCEALDGNDLRQPLTALQSRVISVTGSAEEIDAAPYILDSSAVKDGREDGISERNVQVCIQGQRKLPDRISQEIRILEYKDRLCENQGVPRILYKAEAK